MKYSLLNFELHRLNISYTEASQAIGVTEPEFLLKLYGDDDFSFIEAVEIAEFIRQNGGNSNLDNLFKHDILESLKDSNYKL